MYVYIYIYIYIHVYILYIYILYMYIHIYIYIYSLSARPQAALLAASRCRGSGAAAVAAPRAASWQESPGGDHDMKLGTHQAGADPVFITGVSRVYTHLSLSLSLSQRSPPSEPRAGRRARGTKTFIHGRHAI